MTEHLGLLSDTERRVIVAGNSEATNANDFYRRVAQAKKDFSADPALRGRLIEIPPQDNFGHTITEIERTVRPGDFLVVGGGDGSGNGASQAIMGHTDKEVRSSVAILLMPGGQASLGSNDLLEKQGRNMSILSILAQGEVIDFSPMAMTIYNPLEGGPRLELAYFLSGIAGPARSEWQIEQGRKHKWVRKVEAGRRALGTLAIARGMHKQNKEPVQMSVNGVEFTGAGLLSANVDTYAQVLETPVSSREPGLASLVIPDANLLRETLLAARALRKKEGWIVTKPEEALEISIIAQPKQRVLYSRDAEVQELKSDPFEEVPTRIVQRVHDQTVRMVALSRL